MGGRPASIKSDVVGVVLKAQGVFFYVSIL